MNSKNTWLTVLGVIAVTIFVIMTFKFKWYDKMQYWAFLIVLLAFGVIFVILYFQDRLPKNKSMENAAVIARVNDILRATPGGKPITWNGGANNKMGSKWYKKDGDSYMFWAILSKSKEDRWFRTIYSEKHDNLAEIDGAMATEDMQDIFKGFEPFKNDDDLLKKMMGMGMFGRKPKKRTLRMTPTSAQDYNEPELNPGEVEK